MRGTLAVKAGAALCLLWLGACATDSVLTDEAPEHGAAWEDEGPAEAAGLGFTSEGIPERLESPEGAHRGAREAEAARVVRELWEQEALPAGAGMRRAQRLLLPPLHPGRGMRRARALCAAV